MLAPSRKTPPRQRRRQLTVCVAAFAAKERAIVLISDTAITKGDMVSDTSILKMSQIGDTPWHAMMSGSVSLCEEILIRSDAALKEPGRQSDADSHVSMMSLVSRVYAQIYEEHLVARVLTPRLLTKTDLYTRPNTLLRLPKYIYQDVDRERSDFERSYWSANLLVSGFDAFGKPHIFGVHWPGKAYGEDKSGYAAIGVGADAAEGRLMWVESDRDDSLDRVLWESFEAKVQAEIMQGVGYGWDAHILLKSSPKNAKRVPEKLQLTMDKAITLIQQSPFPTEKDKLEPWELPSDDWKQQITTFTESLIPPDPPTTA
jgi:20S proteasome alpha/beta subunit